MLLLSVHDEPLNSCVLATVVSPAPSPPPKFNAAVSIPRAEFDLSGVGFAGTPVQVVPVHSLQVVDGPLGPCPHIPKPDERRPVPAPSLPEKG